MPQEAALKEVAGIKLCRLFANNESPNSADVHVGDSVSLHKASNCKRALGRRGPPKILGIGDAGVAVNLQGQTSDVPRYCVRKKVDVLGAREVDQNPDSG